jgi:phage-related protein
MCGAHLEKRSLTCRKATSWRCLSRRMTSVAPGVEELPVKDGMGAYRGFYFTKVIDAILIFHAFEKKTAKTPSHEIELARKRLKEML